jgi:hypothetical protein
MFYRLAQKPWGFCAGIFGNKPEGSRGHREGGAAGRRGARPNKQARGRKLPAPGKQKQRGPKWPRQQAYAGGGYAARKEAQAGVRGEPRLPARSESSPAFWKRGAGIE